jgi:hypothetical protein
VPNEFTVDESSVRDWLATWQAFVQASAFDDARHLFDPDVLGFGSVATVARSLGDLEASQWRRVWPKLATFTFDDDHLTIVISSDELLAAVAVTWSSTWVDNGVERPRPGRASIVLSRQSTDDPWRAVHTHFSLNPG